MSLEQKLVTAQELLRAPDNGLRRELVWGKIRTTTPAGSAHGQVAMNIGILLGQHVRARDLGVVYAAETGFRSSHDPGAVRAPDTAFVRKERVGAVGTVEGCWPEAPDLTVKVISPNDRFAEVEEKVADWFTAGTRMVLVVTPRARTVTVRLSERGARIFSEGETFDGGGVVPGWTLPVADVFR